MAKFHSRLTAGPIQLLICFYKRAPCHTHVFYLLMVLVRMVKIATALSEYHRTMSDLIKLRLNGLQAFSYFFYFHFFNIQRSNESRAKITLNNISASSLKLQSATSEKSTQDRSSGLLVMGDDSCSRGCGFESQRHFSH